MEVSGDPLLPGKIADLQKCREDVEAKMGMLAELVPKLTGEGVSYLDLKNSLLLHYASLMLSHLVSPSTITDPDSILPALIQTKSLIERLRPLDSKLQYQIDKIAKGNTEAELSFKPNAEAMDSQLRTTDKKGIYVPPKLEAAEPDVNPKEKRRKREEDYRKRELAQSSFLEDLREELGDEPIEIKAPTRSRKLDQIEQREQKYEEENYTRVVLSKKSLQSRKRLRQESSAVTDELEDISKFLKHSETQRKGRKEK